MCACQRSITISSGMFGGTAGYPPFDMEKIAPGLYTDAAATNNELRLLYMSCGTRIRIDLTFDSFPGVHERKVWRHSLADMLPLLFR